MRFVTQLGRPDLKHSRIPTDCPVSLRGDESLELSAFEARVIADASFDPRSSTGGVAWQVTTPGHEGRIRSRALYEFRGPNVAELLAIRMGLKDAADRTIRSVVIYTDSSWSAHVVSGLWEPANPYTTNVVRKARALLDRFGAVAIIRTPTKNIRVVDKAARDAMNRGIKYRWAHERRLRRSRRRSRPYGPWTGHREF
jgi:ribonuclease HI